MTESLYCMEMNGIECNFAGRLQDMEKHHLRQSRYYGIIALILLFLDFDLANGQNRVKLIGEVIDNRIIESQNEQSVNLDESIKADINIGDLHFDCTSKIRVVEVLEGVCDYDTIYVKTAFINSKGIYGLFLLQDSGSVFNTPYEFESHFLISKSNRRKWQCDAYNSRFWFELFKQNKESVAFNRKYNIDEFHMNIWKINVGDDESVERYYKRRWGRYYPKYGIDIAKLLNSVEQSYNKTNISEF